MIAKQYHILNGDVLAHQFPSNIEGEQIIMRECLIDFPFGEWKDEDFFEQRARYLSDIYEEIEARDYHEKSVPEFEKMANIHADVPVNLWFEDDLFCQANLWFVIYFLLKNGKENPLFLIRPKDNLRYGFGGLNESELSNIYRQKTRIAQPELFANLWQYYASNDKEKLQQTVEQIKPTFPFITAAVAAWLDYPQRPMATLKNIMNVSSSGDFNVIFKQFSEREAVYGLGDLQVRRLMEGIG